MVDRPGKYTKITIHDVRPPCPNGDEVHRRFHTMMFERDVMRELIEFWSGGSLQLGQWMTIVPECYRERVGEIAIGVFERSFKNMKFDSRSTLDRFVDELRDGLWNDLEPVLPHEC